MADWNLAELFELVSATIPEQEAVVCSSRRLSYAALDDRATRLANHLSSRGIGGGDHIALYLTNGSEYLEGLLAAAKLGAAAVNVNYRYVAAELSYLLQDSDAHAVIFHRSFGPVIEEVAGDVPLLDVYIGVDDGSSVSDGKWEDYEEAIAAAPSNAAFPDRSGDDLYLLYTGGTTGMPKGVMWHQRDLILGGLLPVGLPPSPRPEDVVDVLGRFPQRRLAASPLMHGVGQWMALATLLGGGTIVLDPEPRFDAARIWELVAAERVEMLSIVGDGMGRPLSDALMSAAATLDLGSLRVLLSSGAVLSPSLKSKLTASLPNVKIVDAYGSSETGAHARSMTGAGERSANRPRFTIDEATAVFDDELRPVAPGSGTIGRLARSGHVAFGYYKDPAKTARTFPVIDGVRWSVSGDYVVVEADGTITPLGRGAACINTGGEKVYPEEVEMALKAHEAVRDAMVVGVPDERFGERVVALIQPGTSEPVKLDELNAHLRRLIAGYKVPKALLTVNAIRRSDAGKPDYQWGRTTALEGLGPDLH